MEAQAGTGSNSGVPAFVFVGGCWPSTFPGQSEPGAGPVGAILVAKGFAKHLLFAFDANVLSEVHEHEDCGPDVPAQGQEFSEKCEPSEDVNRIADFGIKPVRHQFLGFSPNCEGVAKLMAGEHPQKKSWYGDDSANPMMRIVVPPTACDSRKYKIGAEVDESQPLHLALRVRQASAMKNALYSGSPNPSQF